MASDDTMTFHSSSQDEDLDDDMDDGYDHNRHPHPHNLSRLSVCTSSTLCDADDDDDDDDDKALTMYVSHLSIESFGEEGDADEECAGGKEIPVGLSFDSESELSGYYSLPATPQRRRNRVKYCASDNEAVKGGSTGNKIPRRRRRSRRVKREDGEKMRSKKEEEEHGNPGLGDETDQSGGSGGRRGLMVITRPKGGRRSLCMDMEEVKACRDLGFELEHERMLEVPSRLSLSSSTLDNTSSGGNSPISNWRISSPGDDPRDVKARLKVWAQAVAIASTSKYGN